MCRGVPKPRSESQMRCWRALRSCRISPPALACPAPPPLLCCQLQALLLRLACGYGRALQGQKEAFRKEENFCAALRVLAVGLNCPHADTAA